MRVLRSRDVRREERVERVPGLHGNGILRRVVRRERVQALPRREHGLPGQDNL